MHITKRRIAEAALVLFLLFSGFLNIVAFTILREGKDENNILDRMWSDVKDTEQKRNQCLDKLHLFEVQTGVKADSLN